MLMGEPGAAFENAAVQASWEQPEPAGPAPLRA